MKAIFKRISRRYVRANRWMTWGQDSKWRQRVISLAHVPAHGKILDIGTGTGDIILQAVHMDASLEAMGADFTPEMMRVGRERPGGERVRWLISDALELPFGYETFDSVVSGYLLRNVIDVDKVLAEQYRVLKWGGHMANLDTTPPPVDLWHLPVRFYLKYLVPLIGRVITGNTNAYRYLADSTQAFMEAQAISDRMKNVGFKEVEYCYFMGGVIAIHWGTK